MRIAITCECPHCHKPIFGQSTVSSGAVDIGVRRERIPEIVTHVSKETGVSESEIYARSRRTEVARARHIVWYACRQAGYSFEDIAVPFGRDHSTIRYGANRIAKEATI